MCYFLVSFLFNYWSEATLEETEHLGKKYLRLRYLQTKRKAETESEKNNNFFSTWMFDGDAQL